MNIKTTLKISPEDSRKPAIEARAIGLCYKRSGRFAFRKQRHLRRSKEFWALRDVSFDIHKGECVGIIGRNGSGKSTLSMMCAGILQPDEGSIKINGKSRLLALGVGFRPEFTGKENIMISASILGLGRKEVIALLPEIEEFADLGDFIDEPVKTYSSGMKSRLAFAITTSIPSEILVIDEAMSTGDASFRKKAELRMKKMLNDSGTVIIVSHNPVSLKKMCNRILWLDKATLMMDDKPIPVIEAYNAFCEKRK